MEEVLVVFEDGQMLFYNLRITAAERPTQGSLCTKYLYVIHGLFDQGYDHLQKFFPTPVPGNGNSESTPY